MPEFILNTDGATADNWHNLDSFTQGFIEAAFFSDSSCFDSSEFFGDEAQERVREGQADGSIPNDAGPSDIDAESLAKVKAFCAAFQTRAADVLTEAYEREYDETQAGRDLYFTYAGHGVGYWDRDALKANDADLEEYERLTAVMIANRDNNAKWDEALSARHEVESRGIGKRLSKLCGRGEINLDAYESEESESGFYVSFYIG
jgi:hypothetical protein